MALLSLEDLNRQVAEFVQLERSAQARTDKRSEGWRVFLKARHLIQLLSGPDVQDDAGLAAFAARALPLLQRRREALEQEGGYNPISVQVHEKSEIDLVVLQKHLASQDHKTRLDAVAAVGELGYVEALPRLLEMLASETHLWVISKLTKVIGQVGGGEVLAVLTPFLQHEDARVRANTVEGLEAIPGEEKFTVLMPLLEDESPRVRANTLKAIQSLGGERFTRLIRGMIRHPDFDHRRSALYVLSAMRNAFAHECLVVMLSDDHPQLRARAIEVLEQRPDLPSVQALVQLVQTDCGEATRARAIDALRTLRGSATPELLLKVDELLRHVIHGIEEQRGVAASAPGSRDILEELAVLSVPLPEPELPEPPAPDLGATDPGADRDSAAVDAAQEATKAVARMSSALSALSPRERREAEKLIRSGKISNEMQLKTTIARLRNKRGA